ncbi:isoamylase early set domain-containing protein [Nonomuraea sp. SYSU D8015]|uniref:isoamylase early set domain-containing protein n=1 Tax=Nonomuraea sp. SYSU D8015 TaxID=2593644 RepID=UPI0016609D08|nr:isoamylase early set domain-containing protein [Nonomuraea sp. SYSU D8015]
MIRQDEPAKDGLVAVTFTLPADIPGHISVVGDFNHWDPYAHPMRRTEHGVHTAVVRLPQGASICFRYLAEGGRWLDDPDAGSRDDRGCILRVSSAASGNGEGQARRRRGEDRLRGADVRLPPEYFAG